MKKNESLIGLNVRIYTEQYEIDGVINHIDEEKIIINSDPSVYLIYKSKIDMVLLNPSDVEKEKEKEKEEPTKTERYYEVVEPRGDMPHGNPDNINMDSMPRSFVQNGVAEQNQYGTFIPRTLLEQKPPDIVDLMMGEGTPQVDLSVSASVLSSEKALLARAERQKIIEKNKKSVDDPGE